MAPSTSSRQPLWLRAEKKEFERRSALTPTTARKLIDAGFDISVERDEQRIFDDEEFEKVGCKLVDNWTWENAPLDTPILGLKELPVEKTPIRHTHIQFAHCYKQQGGWAEVLDRFIQGHGLLYDLEFLQDENGRRVAAFGFHAGFAGAAAACLALHAQVMSDGKERLGPLEPYPNEDELVNEVKSKFSSVEDKLGRPVRVLVIGALGRCGRGAVSFFQKAGIKDENICQWDMRETAKGGPFQEIIDVDIFVNCIYLSHKIPHFVDKESIKAAGAKRNLAVIADVSCDTTNPNNPIPLYDINTTFDKPTVDVDTSSSGGPVMTVVSIDHLPTLLPRESSEAFSHDLLPTLLQLPDRQNARVWKEAEALFNKKRDEAIAELKSRDSSYTINGTNGTNGANGH
ncbi:Formate/glycerate dehydrogenase catalytic domain-like protein [Cystobasidium minutum MCA 4210]|uniref:Formate/glycerate dehydrogenase catalytic domain-like protein n=1 Tax=Cystobasidium minutum MCA 4210 TaxID=1397322 RepID=UPI0034CE3E61|eukprot:jgi/Rhomi1/53830/CE53829_1864